MGKLSSLMWNTPILVYDPLTALGSSFRDRPLNPRGVRPTLIHSCETSMYTKQISIHEFPMCNNVNNETLPTCLLIYRIFFTF